MHLPVANGTLSKCGHRCCPDDDHDLRPIPMMDSRLIHTRVDEEQVAGWVSSILKRAFPSDISTAQVERKTVQDIFNLRAGTAKGIFGAKAAGVFEKRLEVSTPSLGGLGGCVVAMIVARYWPDINLWDLAGAFISNIGCMGSDPLNQQRVQKEARKELSDQLQWITAPHEVSDPHKEILF